MPEFIYNISAFNSSVDITKLTEELKDADFVVFSISSSDDNEVYKINVDRDDKSAIDVIIAAHSGIGSLEYYKNIKYRNIDNRTNELISRGFNYAGKMFSLSLPAQIRLLGINQVRNDPNLIYPIRWNTMHDNDYYEIANPEDFHLFYMKSLATYRAHVDAGTALKDQVREATSKAEVDAIIDNR